ncbi:hypothetical protein SPRG_06682 [Saprolegnia parasitica CBS 223.65]|uniref:Uncharacterized protein n=1 Tax=Saprolegnia parasitica (strain CBS 223.65) TaxID=695850 RepID=A0A067CCE4_SAPPC|nr:hypothetical protein SPRG_06682 [Saprolegnia parasitica CBS 223.65]KDO28444.1 hypothetical protein SPRG_06682 [Saprolegnia parasitica CBS 223.65]|eukprot:XP_012200884.1 hypothetical protein SPRG_06682 [Saprolegnia parasitica CBS 223.65]
MRATKKPLTLRYRKKVIEDSPPAKPTPMAVATKLLAPAAATPAIVYVVTISDLQFHPPRLIVPIGSTVRWQVGAANEAVHAITLALGDAFVDSPTLDTPGAVFEHKCSSLGTVSYGCNLYSFMTGSIVVVASLSTTEAKSNQCYADYPRRATQPRRRPSSSAMGPFQKQLAVWRAKQPKAQLDAEGDGTVDDEEGTFSEKDRAARKKVGSTRAPDVVRPTISVVAPVAPVKVLGPVTTDQGAAAKIALDHFEFVPTTLDIMAGETVVWSVSALGMVEHALQLTVSAPDSADATVLTPPLRSGDSVAYIFPHACVVDVACSVYDVKGRVVVHDASSDVLVVGDVECPVVAPPAESSAILRLLATAHEKHEMRRTSYMAPPAAAIPGFDALAAYDFLKQRANNVKLDSNVVYACPPAC